jgi:hypothetical protein
MNESDGEGFLADRRGAERPSVLDVHDLFATKRADKKTSQMAHLFSDEPLVYQDMRGPKEGRG